MHYPEGGLGDSVGRSREVHPNRRFANVLGVQASRSGDEVQGAIDAVGIREGDDAGGRRRLNRRRDHQLRVEKGGRDTGSVRTSLEVDVLAGHDADLAGLLDETRAPEGESLTTD
jgi:hypothetical protein